MDNKINICVSNCLNIAIQEQCELRCIRPPVQEIRELISQININIIHDQLNIEIPEDLYRKIDALLFNEICPVCGSLIPAGKHSSLECSEILIIKIMHS
jgi:hypothetical protein